MDRESFSRLIHEQHATLSAYARMITKDESKAAEVVQDTFVAAWQNIGKFDVSRDISSWLRGIVRNKWREACRRHSREIGMDEETLAAIEETVTTWHADQPEIFDRLAECRKKLPPTLAEGIDAYYGQSQSTEEAAACLHISSSSLRKRLERARQALRQCLQSKSIPTLAVQ